MPSLVVTGEGLLCFGAGATDQQLHFRVPLEDIDRHDYPRHAALRETSHPLVNAASITRPGLRHGAIVERLADIRVSRMGLPRGRSMLISEVATRSFATCQKCSLSMVAAPSRVATGRSG